MTTYNFHVISHEIWTLNEQWEDTLSNHNPFEYSNRIPTIPVRYFMRYDDIDRIIKEEFPETYREASVTLFIDTRSTIPSVFTKDGMNDIIESYVKRGDKFVYARTLITMINHWCRYFRKNNMRYNIIMFSEEGESAYHTKLSRDYKAKRQLAKLKIADFNTDILDKAGKLIDYNIGVLDTVLNKLSNIYYINLKYLEADFVPHYIKNKYGINNENNLSIILSSDKDLTQTIDYHSIQIARRGNIYNVYNASNAIDSLGTYKLKNFQYGKLRTPNSVALLLAIMGDKEDGIKGLPGVGLGNAYSYLDGMLDRGIINNEFDWSARSLINLIESNELTGKIDKLIINRKESFLIDYKLASFEELINNMSVTNMVNIDSVISREGKYSIGDVSALDINTTLRKICIYDGNFNSLIV